MTEPGWLIAKGILLAIICAIMLVLNRWERRFKREKEAEENRDGL